MQNVFFQGQWLLKCACQWNSESISFDDYNNVLISHTRYKKKQTLVNIGELEGIVCSIGSCICVGYTAISRFLVNTNGIVQVVLKWRLVRLLVPHLSKLTTTFYIIQLMSLLLFAVVHHSMVHWHLFLSNMFVTQRHQTMLESHVVDVVILSLISHLHTAIL